MNGSGKIYFASDFHLGAPDYASSRERELKVVNWLKSIRNDVSELYLLGDIWDFWFEYGQVVPKGYTRLMGTLAEIRDSGVPIVFFGGNHDYWTYGYLEQELGFEVHKKSIRRNIQGVECLVGHGDGLGPGEYDYKFMKRILNSISFEIAFKILHPDIGLGIANYFSRRSRRKNMAKDQQFLGDREYLLQYCKEYLEKDSDVKYFIFGHRHLPLEIPLSHSEAMYYNIGDWIKFNTYGVMENGRFQLMTYK